MKSISFAWTTEALLAGRKTATCRDWKPGYAAGFRAGDLVAAYDRQPRFRGKQVGVIRLTHDATYGPWRDILPDPYEQEGFAYYDEQIAAGRADVAKRVRKALGVADDETIRQWLDGQPSWGEWVIRFELVEIL